MLLIVLFLNIILRDIHRHQQGILNLLVYSWQISESFQVMTLTAIGIDWRTTIADGLYQRDKLVSVPLESIEVVVNQDRVGETLVSHLESLDQPVVACLTATTQRLFHQGVTILVTIDGLIDHIDHRQVVVLLLHLIIPVLDSDKAVSNREVGIEPFVRIL